jgi:hypothetical protein
MTLPNGKDHPKEKEVEPIPQQADKPRLKKYKHEDNVILRRNIELTLAKAIEDMLGGKIVYLVKSSSINHTALQPEGDMFTINFVIEVHEKKTPPGQA